MREETSEEVGATYRLETTIHLTKSLCSYRKFTFNKQASKAVAVLHTRSSSLVGGAEGVHERQEAKGSRRPSSWAHAGRPTPHHRDADLKYT
jgi:hypothetical protein